MRKFEQGSEVRFSPSVAILGYTLSDWENVGGTAWAIIANENYLNNLVFSNI